MTTKQWLKQLKKELRGIPKAEKNKILEFYSEIINDKKDSGFNDYEICYQLGNPYDIAKKTVEESGRKFNGSDIKEDFTEKAYGLPLWLKCFLGFFGIIIGFPLIIAIFATLFSLFIAFFAVMISGFVCAIGGIITVIASIIFGIVGVVDNFIIYLAYGIALTGVGLMLGAGFYLLVSIMTKISKMVINVLFRKGGAKYEKNC